jgi:hypothetical protein
MGQGEMMSGRARRTMRQRELEHLYALIGSITSTWSHIENSVDVTLWKLAGVDAHVGACLTAQIQSLGYRTDALSAMVTVLGGRKKLIASINQFGQRANDLARDRNRVVHDPISVPADGEPEAITVTARKRLVYGFFKGKTEQYSRINSAVGELLGAYLRLEQEISAELRRPAPVPS